MELTRTTRGRSRPTRTASLSAQKAWASLQKSSSNVGNETSSAGSGSGKIDNDENKNCSIDNLRSGSRRSRSSNKVLTLDMDYMSDSKRMKQALSTQSQTTSNENVDVSVMKNKIGDKSCFVTLRSMHVTRSSKLCEEAEESMDVPEVSTTTNNMEVEFKENILKKEEESNDMDFEDVSMPNYMQIREQNLKANQEFLARIGMQKAKEDFESSVLAKKKVLPSQRGLGLGMKQKKVSKDPLPIRQSLRIRKIDPTGVPLPDEPEPEPEPVAVKIKERKEEQRLPETVSIEERFYSKVQEDNLDLKPFYSSILSLDRKEGTRPVTSFTSENYSKLDADLRKLKITENQVAKVVPGRIYSVTWHPSKSRMIAVAGDVQGYVGYWNVLAEENDADMVRAFRPHVKPVTHLHIPFSDGHKLYTCSYDSTLRCGDFEKGVFDLVFSVPEEDDDLFRNFDFIGNSSTMLVSHFRGKVSLVDTRTPSKGAEQVFKVSQQSLRKVSVHPVSTNYFITAGCDPRINLWDIRSMKYQSSKPVQTLTGHSKAVASAFFSPGSGNQILSSSSDDTILIYTAKEGMKFELTTRLPHNNHTGRWLTPFQPTWCPTYENIFVTGSMARPRQIEVFDSNGHLVINLRGDYLGSVCSLNAFHPTRSTAIVGANSSGRLHVFM